MLSCTRVWLDLPGIHAPSVTWCLCISFPKQDPEYNRIAEWLNVKSRHGIVDLSFPLASEAPLGKYTISVQQDMAQKTFSVDKFGETWTTDVREKQHGYLEKKAGRCSHVHQTFCCGRTADWGQGQMGLWTHLMLGWRFCSCAGYKGEAVV